MSAITIRTLLPLLALAALGACSSQPRVEVYLANITPLPSTLFEQRVRLDLRVQNLSEQPISATGADVRLILNDRQLARGVSNQPIEIAPLSDAMTSVDVSSSVFETIRQLLTFESRQAFSYALKGKLFMTGLDRRFSRAGELTRDDLAKLGARRNGNAPLGTNN